MLSVLTVQIAYKVLAAEALHDARTLPEDVSDHPEKPYPVRVRVGADERALVP
jgi:hypothetical protein